MDIITLKRYNVGIMSVLITKILIAMIVKESGRT
jgi:hypothetical protein